MNNEILMCGTEPIGQLYKDTKAEATSIAPIEVSPTEASHNVGTHIMYGGIRYKVTSSISVGDTLTIGENIVAENIEDNLNADDIAYSNGISVKDKIDSVLNRVVNDEKIINIGGNYFALALNNGNINITIPLNGNNNYSQVTLSKSSNINGSIYGSKVASPCTVSMDADILNNVVRLTLTPSVTLSTCTDLAKGFMFNFGERITATLS